MKDDFINYLKFYEDVADGGGLECSATFKVTYSDIFPSESDIDEVHKELAFQLWRQVDEYVEIPNIYEPIIKAGQHERLYVCPVCSSEISSDIRYKVDSYTKKDPPIRYCPVCGARFSKKVE